MWGAIAAILLSLISVPPARATTLTDAWTSARAKVALLADPRIVGRRVDAIVVEAEGDAVTLRGVVASEAARDAASATAGRVPGVTRVENQLSVIPHEVPSVLTSDRTLQGLVAKDLSVFRQPGLGGRTVKVRVTEGVATLTGSVGDIGDWVLASERARQMVGIKAVDNQLWVKNLRLAAP